MKVLVPADSTPMFAGEHGRGLQPVPYCSRASGLWQRAVRRIGSGHRLGGALPLVPADPSALAECEAAWLASVIPAKVDVLEQVLAMMPRLRKIYWQRTDLDGMSLDPAIRRGVEVRTTADLTSEWVAEANLACILADCKRLGRPLRRGRDGSIPFVREFRSIRVGIVGSGRIGRATASRCSSVGIKSAVFTRDPLRLESGDHPFDEVVKLTASLEDVVARFDYLVLALPLNSFTSGMVSGRVLRSMQDTVLVNLARPLLVDQPAMLSALRGGRLSAAWVSRLDTLSVLDRLRAARTQNLFLTHNLEAHVAAKQGRAFQQFVDFVTEGAAAA